MTYTREELLAPILPRRRIKQFVMNTFTFSKDLISSINGTGIHHLGRPAGAKPLLAGLKATFPDLNLTIRLMNVFDDCAIQFPVLSFINGHRLVKCIHICAIAELIYTDELNSAGLEIYSGNLRLAG